MGMAAVWPAQDPRTAYPPLWAGMWGSSGVHRTPHRHTGYPLARVMERPTHPGHPTPDPLIDEVRAARRELSERFGNGLRRLAEHLR